MFIIYNWHKLSKLRSDGTPLEDALKGMLKYKVLGLEIDVFFYISKGNY